MPRSHIDHIVVTARDLATGVELIRHTLGVAPQAGGEHPDMGTHNYFLRLGEKVYLEVIAANPAAPHPSRPRWFQLDRPDWIRVPRLATWVARTDDIRAATDASPLPLGNAQPMRRGKLNWLITIPDDGSLPLGGVAPTLIQWPTGVHPADTLQDAGCSLMRVEGFHSDTVKMASVLESIGFEGAFGVSSIPSGQQPFLVAHIQTPAGIRRLGCPWPAPR